MTIGMNAPNLQPFFTVVAKSTTVYVANANGVIANVAPGDINDLENARCVRIPTLVGPTKFGNIQTRKPFASPGGQLGGAGFTLSTAWAVEAPFSWVRIVLYNHTASPVTYAKVFGAPSQGLNDYVNPLNASGSTYSPTQFTFNDQAASVGAGRFPPSASGSNTSVTIPAAASGGGTQAVVPGVAYSDWMYMRSIPRTDGVQLPLFFTRIYDGTQPILECGEGGATPPTAFDPTDLGRICRTWYQAGDQTANTAMSSATRNNDPPHMAIQTISDTGGLSVVAVGDSITQGFTTLGQANCFGHQACVALSTPVFPVTFANHGQPGQGTPQIYINALNRLVEHTPDVLLLPVYSPNDDHPLTQATADTSWAYAMAVAAYCFQHNVVPIFWTGLPGPSVTTLGQDAIRIALNNRLKAASTTNGGRFMVADFDALLTDGGLPANGGICQLQTQYTTTDATFVHPNDLGHSVLAQQALIPLLQKIMSCRPN